MIIIKDEKEIEKTSLKIQAFIRSWWKRLNDEDPQQNSYYSDFPIGSLGEVWIAENEEEVKDKDFIEIIQVNLNHIILFIGTWIPTDGTPCADIFISSEILSIDTLNQFKVKADEVIEIEGFEENAVGVDGVTSEK